MKYAVAGKFYLNPTAIASAGGGDLVGEVEERIFAWDANEKAVRMRTSLGDDPEIRSYRGRSEGATLSFNPKDQEDVETLKMVYAQLTTDGVLFRPAGGTSTRQNAILPSFAGVLRPSDAAEDHIYSPAWSLHEDTIQIFTENHVLTSLDSIELVLVAGKDSDSNGPSYMKGSAAALEAIYFP